jgi:hypothetical protein
MSESNIMTTKPPSFSADERVYLESLSDEDVLQAALADPDAQPATDEMLMRAQRARLRRQAEETRARLQARADEAGSETLKSRVSSEQRIIVNGVEITVKPLAETPNTPSKRIDSSSSRGSARPVDLVKTPRKSKAAGPSRKV